MRLLPSLGGDGGVSRRLMEETALQLSKGSRLADCLSRSIQHIVDLGLVGHRLDNRLIAEMVLIHVAAYVSVHGEGFDSATISLAKPHDCAGGGA
jgi:hypothetical protein